MQLSNQRLLAAGGLTMWGHSGKIDHDNGIKCRHAKATRGRSVRGIKKKARRLLDSLISQEEV